MNQCVLGTKYRESKEAQDFWAEFPALLCDDPARSYNGLVAQLRHRAYRYFQQASLPPIGERIRAEILLPEAKRMIANGDTTNALRILEAIVDGKEIVFTDDELSQLREIE